MAKRKRTFKQAKHTVRKITNIKEGRFSLQFKVMSALVVFALLLMGFNLGNIQYGCKLIFEEHFAEELSERTDGLHHAIMGDAERTDRVLLKAMEETFGEAEALGGRLSELKPIAGYDGYVIASTKGEVISSDLDGEADAPTMLKAASLLEADGSFSGVTELPGIGYCVAVGHSLPGETGCVFVVLHTLSNNDYLDMMKHRHLTDITIFDNLTRNATTLVDESGKRMVGTTLVNGQAEQAVFVRKEKYHGMAVIGGKDMYVQYEPIVGGDGSVIGIFFTGIEASVSSKLTKLVSMTMLIGSLVISTLLIVLFFIFVRKFLTKPIRDIAHVARLIAQNDLTVPVTQYHTGDEIEYLSASMEDMREALHETINEVVDTANILKNSSVELSDASMTLSDGANKQAASLEEISSSIEEMTANIQQNSENSQRTNKLMHKTNDAVEDIVGTSAHNMEASRRIMDSIRSINTLVDQTNILSLNASVEAARAGSHGRGFAVVAKEVGRLADLTKTTAGSVSTTAEATVDGAEQINMRLGEVKPQIEKVVSLMNEIAANSTEQGVGAEQINTAIMDLNKLTQHAAASAEEIAANAEELAGAAEHLHDAVSLFKV